MVGGPAEPRVHRSGDTLITRVINRSAAAGRNRRRGWSIRRRHRAGADL